MGRWDAPVLALSTLDCLLSSLPEYDNPDERYSACCYQARGAMENRC